MSLISSVSLVTRLSREGIKGIEGIEGIMVIKGIKLSMVSRTSVVSRVSGIQDGDRLWRHLLDYCCHGNQLDTTWFHLIECTNESYYMYIQLSCQSDELCRK